MRWCGRVDQPGVMLGLVHLCSFEWRRGVGDGKAYLIKSVSFVSIVHHDFCMKSFKQCE